MATVEMEVLQLGPHSNGMSLSPWEFDAAEFEPGWRYDLVNGVLIVNPAPALEIRDATEGLGHWLRNHQESHPQGDSLDFTVSEQTVHIGPHRRRVDRATRAPIRGVTRAHPASWQTQVAAWVTPAQSAAIPRVPVHTAR